MFCWVLVVITRTDLEHRLIPDKIVLPGAVVLLALRTIDDPSVEWILARSVQVSCCSSSCSYIPAASGWVT